MERVDGVVVGAGAVGLAIARALAREGFDTLVVEQADRIGTGISSRSSEVVHAGLYYPPGSLKARLCTAGRDLLWAYCAERGIGHWRCGKLVVAPDAAQVQAIEAIAATAAENGVEDIRLVTGADAQALEPELRCEAALLSPSTGIFDSHGYMLALQADAEAAGATFAFNAAVTGVTRNHRHLTLHVKDSREPVLKTRLFVNAAGLGAVDLARRTKGLAAAHVPRLRWAKGSYFALSGRAPFKRLIYPQPELGGCRACTSRSTWRARPGSGRTWSGWMRSTTRSIPPRPRTSKRRSGPGGRAWSPAELSPAYAAIRPKLTRPGEPATDFRIDGPAVHGIAGLVNLFGIESPGLTASLAIAEEVVAIARDELGA